MPDLYETWISALRGGAGTFGGLSSESSGLAGRAQSSCQSASSATAGFGSLGEALTNAGTKLRGALGEGGEMGLSGLMRLTSTKLGECADAYAQVEAVNSRSLQSGLGGLGG